MKIFFVAFLLCLFCTGTASAEISRQYNHEAQTFSVISTVGENYDEDMKLSFRFMKEYRGNANDVAYSLMILFDPIDRNKLMKSYEFFEDGFLYFLEGDTQPRNGAFFGVSSPGVASSKDRMNVSIYPSGVPGEYSVTARHDTFQYGGSFFTEYNKDMAYYRKYKMMKPQLAFYDDLMTAIKNNKEITLKLPYAKNLSDVDRIEYVVFKLNRNVISEWNAVTNFDLKAELQKYRVDFTG